MRPPGPDSALPRRMIKKDLAIAPAGEALLILIAAGCGYFAHQPLIFASLGPTAYELIETPHRRSARPYSILVGHLTGIACAWLALFLTHARSAPPVSAAGVPLLRVGSVVLAAGLTVLGNLLLRSAQPAALSTTLLISSGIMQTGRDTVVILAAIILILLAGEPLRRLRLRHQTTTQVEAQSQQA